MPTLPLTVVSVVYRSTGLYNVTLALADGSTVNMVIPDSLATVEGVRISALAYAQLADPDRPLTSGHHRHHRRYDPRT